MGVPDLGSALHPTLQSTPDSHYAALSSCRCMSNATPSRARTIIRTGPSTRSEMLSLQVAAVDLYLRATSPG
jgi:hypothetical protein